MGECETNISSTSTRISVLENTKSVRYIGIYQQEITLAAGGEFFQAIPTKYQNGGYFYLINCSINSLQFTANMEGFYMAVKNRGTGT